MADIKKTLCDKAWNYPVVNFYNNEVSMCCHAHHQKIQEKDINHYGKDIFTKFKPLKDAKLDLLNGVETSNCTYCWYLEKKGIKSSRSAFKDSEKYFKDSGVILDNLTDDKKQDIIDISTPKLIEISVGNTCDLKCFYCNSIFSSQWASENFKFGEPFKDGKGKDTVTNKMEQAWWDWFNSGIYNDINSIGIIGGEPLIIDKTYEYIPKILEKCKSRNAGWPIVLSIVTNLNAPEIYFNKFLELIPEIINNPNIILDLSVSIESLNNRAEFIRTGLRWERFEKNLHKILEVTKESNSKIHLSFMTAISALCISDFPNFINWVVNLQEKFDIPINLRGSQVVFPNWLSPTMLTEDYIPYIIKAKELINSKKLRDDCYRHGTWTNYSSMLDEVIKGILYPTKSLENRKIFVEKINLLSSRRNLDFKNTFPEMVDFYERCNNEL